MMTKKQRSREVIARICDRITPKSESGKQLRAINRRVDMKKGRTK